MANRKELTRVTSQEIDTDRVVEQRQKVLNTEYWCRGCGNQFTGKLQVNGTRTASGSEKVEIIRCDCPSCNSSNTSPHVKPEWNISSSDGTRKSLVAEVRYAEEYTKNNKRILPSLRKILGKDNK